MSEHNAQNSTVASQTLLLCFVTAVKPSIMFDSESVSKQEFLYAMIPKLISDLSLQRRIYQQDDLTRVCPLHPAYQLVR